MKKWQKLALAVIFVGAVIFLYQWNNRVVIDTTRYKSFLHFPLSAGLPPSLEALSQNSNNKLFLIIRKPEKTVDYSAPNTLKKSIYRSSFKGIDVGHVQVAWSCKINGQIFKSGTGFNGERNNQVQKMISTGFGATAFVSHFTDGYFEGPVDIEYTIKKHHSKVKIISLTISEDECEKVLGRFWKLVNRKDHHRFSFSYSENSMSCSSFAFELLKPIHRLRKQYRSYGYKHMYLPKKLFGFPKNLEAPIHTEIPTEGIQKNKSVRLLASLPKEWSDDGVHIQIFDIEALSEIPNN